MSAPSPTLLDHRCLDDLDAYLLEGPLAVALSGGPDSMALIHLLKKWCTQKKRPLVAIHINHTLRAIAGKEADQLSQWCAQQGISYVQDEWRHNHPKNGVQRKARKARYELIQKHCMAQGIQNVFLAHHLDDQRETFLMRLEQGSGLKGLACMAPHTDRQHIRYLRPFLGFSKSDLLAYCQYHKLPVLHDPSNEDSRYARNRIRSAVQKNPEAVPMNVQKIHHTQYRLQLANQAVVYYTNKALQEFNTFHPLGFASIDLSLFSETPMDVCLRVLEETLQVISGSSYPPRFEGLLSLYELYQSPPESRHASTLGGCHIFPKQSCLIVKREPSAIAPAQIIHTQESFYWDNRFFIDRITQNALDLSIEIDMLGRHIHTKNTLPAWIKRLPNKIWETVPGVFCNGRFVSTLSPPGETDPLSMPLRITFQPERLKTLNWME